MAEQKRQKINLGGYLQSKGYSLSRLDEEGNHFLTDQNGAEVKFDAQGFLKEKGYDPAKFDIHFNSPKEALDESPISMVDRAKLALGNTKGNINYLKNKFEAVAVDGDQGVLVKNRGVWQKVDASGLGNGDAWEKSKELANDVIEGAISFVPGAVLSTAGAVAGASAGTAGGAVVGSAVPVLGTAAGGIAGGVAGGIAGAAAGGGAAEAMRTSLGRIVGTYDATPMEQLKDIGFESLLNAGGQTLAIGVKPTVAILRKALKPISEGVTPVAKDALSQFWGLTTGAGAQRVRFALDAPDEVVANIAKVSKAASTFEAENALKDTTISEAKALMAPARKALTSKYGELQGDFLKNVPSTMEFKVQDMLKNSMLEMEKAGLGKITTDKKGISRFALHEQKEIDKQLAKGNIPDVVDTKSVEALGDFVSELNKFAAVPVLKGRSGAESVLKIKRALSDSFYSITDDKAPNIKRAVAQFSSRLNQHLGGVFDNSKVPGLTEKYTNMSNLYSKYSGAVNEADRMIREVNGAEVFVNKLTSNAGANRTLKGTAGDLAELLGPEGEKRIQNILAADAARGFLGYMPNMGKLTTAGAVGAGAAGAVAAGANPVLTAAAASQTSPRAVLKQIEYATKFKNFISGLSPAARTQFLRDPKVVEGTIRTMFTAYQNEEKERDELLKQSGVVP